MPQSSSGIRTIPWSKYLLQRGNDPLSIIAGALFSLILAILASLLFTPLLARMVVHGAGTILSPYYVDGPPAWPLMIVGLIVNWVGQCRRYSIAATTPGGSGKAFSTVVVLLFVLSAGTANYLAANAPIWDLSAYSAATSFLPLLKALLVVSAPLYLLFANVAGLFLWKSSLPLTRRPARGAPSLATTRRIKVLIAGLSCLTLAVFAFQWSFGSRYPADDPGRITVYTRSETAEVRLDGLAFSGYEDLILGDEDYLYDAFESSKGEPSSAISWSISAYEPSGQPVEFAVMLTGKARIAPESTGFEGTWMNCSCQLLMPGDKLPSLVDNSEGGRPIPANSQVVLGTLSKTSDPFPRFAGSTVLGETPRLEWWVPTGQGTSIVATPVMSYAWPREDFPLNRDAQAPEYATLTMSLGVWAAVPLQAQVTSRTPLKYRIDSDRFYFSQEFDQKTVIAADVSTGRLDDVALTPQYMYSDTFNTRLASTLGLIASTLLGLAVAIFWEYWRGLSEVDNSTAAPPTGAARRRIRLPS